MVVEEFLNVLDKTLSGQVCERRDWEARILPPMVKEKLKEHGLEKTCNPENPINTDDSLVDEFWKAGFELAVESGFLCSTTERLVKFSESELEHALATRPSQISLGYGPDEVHIKPRMPEDPHPPITALSTLGMMTSEELYVPISQSIVQYRVVDTLLGGVLETIHGRPVKTKTPYETLMGKYEGLLVREALRKAGRPGMPVWGVEGSASEYGQLGGYGAPDSYDSRWSIAIILLPTPFILDYSILHKVAHSLNFEAPIEAGHWTMIGGSFGTPEGCALGAIAGHILECAGLLPTVIHSDVLDIRYLGNTGREALWAASIKAQAKSRNSRTLHFGCTSQVAGPCTDMLLYETATISITESVSGVAIEMGTRPTGCKYPNYGSGLENKFCAEVLKSAAGMKRADANEIVKALVPKYEDKLRYPPKGKSFTECTNIKTLKPTKEWQDIYDRAWNELEDLGLRNLY